MECQGFAKEQVTDNINSLLSSYPYYSTDEADRMECQGFAKEQVTDNINSLLSSYPYQPTDEADRMVGVCKGIGQR